MRGGRTPACRRNATMPVFTGGPGPDVLSGDQGGNLILGRGGADVLIGREADDIILGGAGRDVIAGDTIPRPGGPVQPSEFGPFPGARPLGPGDNLILAGAGDDRVTAGFGADTVLGGAGNDTIEGYGASDVSPVGSGNLIAADGPDLLVGGAGNDLIRGGGGADLLFGGRGADTLVGGVGVDTLAGGAGADRFVFGRSLEPEGTSFTADTGAGPGQRDVILDFREGLDRIDLAAYRNFFPGPGGQPPPDFLGTEGFGDSRALQVRYEIDGCTTLVQVLAPFGDASQAPAPLREIELAGRHVLEAGDFILA
ncbi:calcium-binding protein [Dankookia rubra]|uniref:Calcium-binding protein n=2 Tax=Dankookia rubra TaxID=1442381 RepID=A0A4R5QBZ7_9PROT|nr:calcium-binding protein [Dankookia rubra]